ncbi:hypothetical protein MHYP_G00200560 [Metynnis hypsauchen]
MEMLKAVFERLDQASLTLNLAKCDFGKATVLYLGQELDVDACDFGAGAVLLQEDSQGIDHPVELCLGLAAVGGVLPPEKVKGGVTQEVEERHGVDCWPLGFVCVFVGKFGETV